MFSCGLFFCLLKMDQDSNGFLDINVLWINHHMPLQILNPLTSENRSWVFHYQKFSPVKNNRICPWKTNSCPNDLQLSILQLKWTTLQICIQILFRPPLGTPRSSNGYPYFIILLLKTIRVQSYPMKTTETQIMSLVLLSFTLWETVQSPNGSSHHIHLLNAIPASRSV